MVKLSGNNSEKMLEHEETMSEGMKKNDEKILFGLEDNPFDYEDDK